MNFKRYKFITKTQEDSSKKVLEKNITVCYNAKL